MLAICIRVLYFSVSIVRENIFLLYAPRKISMGILLWLREINVFFPWLLIELFIGTNQRISVIVITVFLGYCFIVFCIMIPPSIFNIVKACSSVSCLEILSWLYDWIIIRKLNKYTCLILLMILQLILMVIKNLLIRHLLR